MTKFQTHFLESKDVLVKYLKHPVQEIHHIPDWSWEHLLIFQAIITAATGLLAGIASKSIFSILVQLIMTPILTLILIFVSCFFFYYAFQIFAEKTVPFRQLFQTVLFANIPFFIFQIGATYLSLLTMLGMAFTALILIVAFVEKFKLEKKIVMRMILGLYIIFFSIWLWGRFDGSRMEKTWQKNKVENIPEVKLSQ
jgi:hypothetical protein